MGAGGAAWAAPLGAMLPATISPSTNSPEPASCDPWPPSPHRWPGPSDQTPDATYGSGRGGTCQISSTRTMRVRDRCPPPPPPPPPALGEVCRQWFFDRPDRPPPSAGAGTPLISTITVSTDAFPAGGRWWSARPISRRPDPGRPYGLRSSRVLTHLVMRCRALCLAIRARSTCRSALEGRFAALDAPSGDRVRPTGDAASPAAIDPTRGLRPPHHIVHWADGVASTAPCRT